jgi:hypothetical protein
MTTNNYFFLTLSFIAGLSTYCSLVSYIKAPISMSYILRIESHLLSCSTLIGMLGTFLGFYVGTSSGLTQESASEAIALSVPSTIAGLEVYLYGSLLVVLRKASQQGELCND